MNYLTLMVTIAITAILASIAVPDIGTFITQSETANAQRSLHSAWNLLADYAVTYGGATLSYNGRTLKLTSGTASTAQVLTWTLPANTIISLDGNPFSCLGLNGDGIPAITATCSSIPAGYSASVANNGIPFYLSVSGGTYVPAVS